jgi:hypothetical protein
VNKAFTDINLKRRYTDGIWTGLFGAIGLINMAEQHYLSGALMLGLGLSNHFSCKYVHKHEDARLKESLEHLEL